MVPIPLKISTVAVGRYITLARERLLE